MTDTITSAATNPVTEAEASPDANAETSIERRNDSATSTDGASSGRHECVDVDPTTLILGNNVRGAAHLDRQFLASLREYGVMDPIHVTRADDGTLTVKRGQRRTIGAVKVGLGTVPVLIVDQDGTEADRIAKQWAENERRDALTDADRLAAVEQLTLLGVPAGAIAKRLGTPRKVIDAAVQANASDVAKAAAAKHALTLTDAALIAEFEDDEQVVREILRAVKDGDSAAHVAQRARDERARQQVWQAAVQALEEANVTVIDRPHYSEKVIKELRDIRLLNKNSTAKAKAPTEAEHASCPGHAAYVTVDTWGRPPQARTTYVCTNPTANGHALHTYGGTTLPGQRPTGVGPMSDEQKAERRTLIARNRAWESAEQVRRAWITEAFLTRTTPPKNAEAFLALAVVRGEHTEDYNTLYATLTGQQSGYSSDLSKRLVARAEAGTTRQALMLAVALLVCAWEATTSRNTWRRPAERDRRHLRALIEWGYKPSDVELLVLADDKPDGSSSDRQANSDPTANENGAATDDAHPAAAQDDDQGGDINLDADNPAGEVEDGEVEGEPDV